MTSFSLPLHSGSTPLRVVAGWCAAAWAFAGLAAPASAQVMPDYKEMEGIDIIEHVDYPLPLELRFVDERGKHVRLENFFKDGKPRIITMNYSSCPLLCSTHLNGLLESLEKLEWTAGDQYDLITVSFDPKESYQTAAQTRQKYLGIYGRTEARDAWRFLTGERKDIHALAEALGIVFRYLPDVDEYVHPAATIICTPDGKIARYIYGPRPEAETIRRALEGAAVGKVEGSTPEERNWILTCFFYDATKGRYGPTAVGLMRLGGVLTIAGLLVGLLIFWRRETRKRVLLEVPE